MNFQKKSGNKLPFWISYGSTGVLLMLLGVFLVFFWRSTTNQVLNSGAICQLPNGNIRLDTQSSRFILRNGIPALEQTSGEDDPFRLLHFNWSEIYWKLATNIRQATPEELLKNQFPLLAIVKPKPLPIFISQPLVPKPIEENIESVENPTLPPEPEVLIFHTHTSESYIPVSGKDHLNEQKGDIVKVGEHLEKVLEEQYGINAIHNEDLHDIYPFRKSYLRSQATVEKYLAEYPSIKVVLDIHRDATPGVEAVCNIKGERASTILLVVGSDKMGLPHPNWRKNQQFANDLSQLMNDYYPGLNSGVIISKARYGQHLHPHEIIVEIGDQNSTLDEAYRAAELFAGVLAAEMKN